MGDPGRLKHPRELRLETTLPPGRIRERMARDIAAETPLDAAGSRSRRRLRGRIEDDSITLWVFDAQILTRRKNWNVEFRGRLLPTGEGTVVAGDIDIPDRVDLSRLMWLVRVASLFPFVLAVVLHPAGGVAPFVLPATVAMAIIGVLSTLYLERDGEAKAAQDADLLTSYLGNTFGAG